MNGLLNVAIIANNYGENYDGIGNYAQIEVKELPNTINTDVFTGICKESDSFISRFTNKGMINAIRKAIRKNRLNKYNLFLIEYPFVEWNPRIILEIGKIKKQCDGKVVISLHEYARVNRLRKKVIQRLCLLSDAVLVSDKNMREDIRSFSNNIYIRNIPSNIYDKEALAVERKRNANNYAYFGLINGSKAINEMLEAWDEFNSDNEKKLFILTSSKVNDSFQSHLGVYYKYNKNDSEIIATLKKCRFAILPIRPYIDSKNASFKTCTMCGCEIIGKFDDNYKKLPFVHNVNNYSKETILQMLKSTYISDYCNTTMNKKAAEFGSQYAPSETSKSLSKILFEISNK